jgi:hypothetical protein
VITRGRSPTALVALFCSAQALSMAGFALVPSLLPQLSQRWALSATEGGWLGGIFFLGYILAVPLLVSLTDRIDARRIYLASATLSGVALAGFAGFADSFAAALGWWWLAGLGLAGTYMPGLKALTDRCRSPSSRAPPRSIPPPFGVGAGLSYLWIELLQAPCPGRHCSSSRQLVPRWPILLVWRAVSPGDARTARAGARSLAQRPCATPASWLSVAATSATIGSSSVSVPGWWLI